MQADQQTLATLSDDALLHALHVIVGTHRRVTAELVLHLGEVDARRLHVEKGFSSLFAYCVERLQFSEDEACRRIEAARLARRFPAICLLLGAGAVSLTVIGLLKPYLAGDNHRELLAGVSGSSVRQAREWLAARFPRPDVPSAIRRRPTRRSGAVVPTARAGVSALPPECVPNDEEPGRSAAPALPPSTHREVPSQRGIPAAPAPTRVDPWSEGGIPAAPAPTRVDPWSEGGVPAASAPARVEAPRTPWASGASARARVEPLSQDRFLVKFTASRALREKLELARDLTSHANPAGAIEVLFERALDLLIAEQQGKQQGRTGRPARKPRPAKDTHVTRAARREVVARDGWRCSFVADDGRRCEAQAFLEFDHETPKGRGGSSRAENLRLLCRAHNRAAAERVYGVEYVSRAIAESRGDGRTFTAREGLAGHGACPAPRSQPAARAPYD
jgi:hypothetical protein